MPVQKPAIYATILRFALDPCYFVVTCISRVKIDEIAWIRGAFD